jgi:hypothetical protein
MAGEKISALDPLATSYLYAPDTIVYLAAIYKSGAAYTNYRVSIHGIANQPAPVQTVTLDGSGTIEINPKLGRTVAITTAGLAASEKVTVKMPYSEQWRGAGLNVYIKSQVDPADITNVYASHGGAGNTRVINRTGHSINYGRIGASGVSLKYADDAAAFVYGGFDAYEGDWQFDSGNSGIANNQTTYSPEPLNIFDMVTATLPTADPHDVGKLWLNTVAGQTFVMVSLG